MMRAIFRYVSLWVIVAFAVGCTADSTAERTSSLRQALSPAPSIPLPANLGASQPSGWQGSTVDLAVADAFAACSVPASGQSGVWPNYGTAALDEYLAQIYTWMGQSQCTDLSTGSPLIGVSNSDVLRYWFLERSVETNPDPAGSGFTWVNDCLTDGTTNAATGQPNPAVANLVASPVPADLLNDPNYSSQPAAQVAALDLNRGSVNVCIAKHLRQMSPGSAGGAALLFTADEQRQLQEVIVERTRIAILQYAALALLFATPATGPTGIIPTLNGAELLQTWASDGNNSGTLQQMSEDFAYAVNLHIQATQEMASLLGRSASAHLPRGGTPANAPDEMWGYESWRQRALALLYGGSPLAQNADLSAPWTSTLDSSDPGRGNPGMSSAGLTTQVSILPFDFPDPAQVAFFLNAPGDDPTYYFTQPYVTTDVTAPEVTEFEQLARRYDVRRLRQVPGASHPGITDPDGSGLWMYMAVEASLRTDNCDSLVNNACQVFQVSDIPVPDGSDAAHSYQSFDLWTHFHITPDHAKLFAHRLDDFVTKSFARGAMNMDGAGSVITYPDATGQSVSWYSIPASAEFHDRKLQQFVGLYTHLGSYHFPDHIDPQDDDLYQGLQGGVGEPEKARRMGSVSALAAVRYGLFQAHRLAPDGRSGLLYRRPEILNMIDGAIGEGGFSIDSATAPDPNAGDLETQQLDSSGNFHWLPTVTTSANDAWWDPTMSSQYSLMAVPWVDTFASNAFLYPNSQSFSGETAATVAPKCPASYVCSPIITGTLLRPPSAPSDVPSTQFWEFSINLPYNWQIPWTFVAVRTPASGPPQYALLGENMQLFAPASLYLSSQTSIGSQYSAPVDGHWIGYGGTLNQLQLRIMAKDGFNPAQPAFDGFGLPMHWSPPANPSLFAGMQGQSAVGYYLAQAQSAATAATSQVKDAVTSLIQDQTDESTLAAAVRKGAQVSQLQQQGLCGTSNPNCDTSTTPIVLDVGSLWDQNAKSVSPPHRSYEQAVTDCNGYTPLNPHATSIAANQIQARLDCLSLGMLALIPSPIMVATAVANHVSDGQLPSFSDYDGGTFQKVLIAQWTAISNIKAAINQMLDAEMAAEYQTGQFYVNMENATTNWDDVKDARCSPTELLRMVVTSSCGVPPTGYSNVPIIGPAIDLLNNIGDYISGQGRSGTCNVNAKVAQDQNPADLTWGDDVTYTTSSSANQGSSVGYFASWSYGTGAGVSTSGPVPVVQRRDFCNSVEEAFGAANAQYISAQYQAYATLANQTTTFVQDVGALRQAVSDGNAQVEQVKLASATARLEAEQTATGQMSNQPVYRQIHSLDVWRAQALLDAARIASVTARRAIESHYVVDMSKLSASEPFVESPQSWSDQVYQYDLSMPSAVGLDLTTGLSDGINPNAVSDYVDNLNRFVNGFAVARPTAVATDDIDVLTLPGPMGLVTNGSATGVDLGAGASWSFQCPSTTGSGTVWVPLPSDGNPNDACGSAASSPSAAQIGFSLDPWGRMNGDIALDPYMKRYNARWVQFAVNVVGTGVLDCTKAADPNACYTQQFVRFEMTHNGPAWATDWNQSWTVLGVPIGQVEGGKALVAEQWLDPLQNNFSKSYVSAIARDEFSDRPFGGQYNIVLDLGPEVQLNRIERLQILVDSNYWVKQQ
jgi:hypothetical protein